MPNRLRKVFFWMHLTAGISVALPVFVLCITGFLMMYERQMETWVDLWNVKSHRPAPDAQALDVENLIRKVREMRGADPGSIKVSADDTQPVEVQMEGKTPSVLYLDAYSGAVIGQPSRKIRRPFRRFPAHFCSGPAAMERDKCLIVQPLTDFPLEQGRSGRYSGSRTLC